MALLVSHPPTADLLTKQTLSRVGPASLGRKKILCQVRIMAADLLLSTDEREHCLRSRTVVNEKTKIGLVATAIGRGFGS